MGIPKAGRWSAICDRCGFKFYSNELKKEWTGLMVCGACWEPRHPQDFVRVKPDKQSVPWTRSEAEDTFAAYCTVAGQSGYSNIAVAGCFIAGNDRLSSSWLADNFATSPINVTAVLEALTDENGNYLLTEDGEIILI